MKSLFLFLLASLFLVQTELWANCNLVHLHINKAVFLQGEQMAFKAYVYDYSKKKGVIEKRNIHLALINAAKDTLVHKKIFYDPVHAHGVLPLTDLDPGNYVLLASLESKNGALCGYPYMQKIQIVGGSNQDEEPATSGNLKLDVYPMGGFLTPGVINKLVYEVHPNEQTSSIQVNLIEAGGKPVTRSGPDSEGYGSLFFIPEIDKEYVAELHIEGSRRLIRNLRAATELAPRLRVSKNIRKGVMAISVDTGSQILKGSKNRLKLRIRSTDEIVFQQMIVNDSSQSKGVILNLRDLPEGFLKIELLDKHDVTLDERLVYNNQPSRVNSVEIVLNRENDSVDLSILPGRTNSMGIEKVFSVSILPAQTKTVKRRKTLFHSTTINPIQTLRDDTSLYVMQPDKVSSEAVLDYAISSKEAPEIWRSLATLEDSKISYTSGFRVTGFINRPPTKSNLKIFVEIPQMGFWEETKLSKNNSFVFTELDVFKNQPISFYLADATGKVLSNSVNLNYKVLNDGLSPKVDDNSIDGEIAQKHEIQPALEGFVGAIDGQIDLDEVVVTGQRLKYEAFVRGGFYGRRIDTTLRGLGNLETLMKTYGYNWSYIPPGPGTMPGRDGVAFVKIKGSGLKLFPTVIYNGKYYNNLDRLLSIPIEEIEEVYYNAGESKSGGTFIIFGKEPEYTSTASSSFVLDRGFDPISDYQLPLYASYERAFFHQYGQIHWKPAIQQERDVLSARLRFDPLGHASFRIIIEGMDERGNLYSFDAVRSIPKD